MLLLAESSARNQKKKRHCSCGRLLVVHGPLRVIKHRILKDIESHPFNQQILLFVPESEADTSREAVCGDAHTHLSSSEICGEISNKPSPVSNDSKGFPFLFEAGRFLRDFPDFCFQKSSFLLKSVYLSSLLSEEFIRSYCGKKKTFGCFLLSYDDGIDQGNSVCLLPTGELVLVLNRLTHEVLNLEDTLKLPHHMQRGMTCGTRYFLVDLLAEGEQKAFTYDFVANIQGEESLKVQTLVESELSNEGYNPKLKKLSKCLGSSSSSPVSFMGQFLNDFDADSSAWRETLRGLIGVLRRNGSPEAEFATVSTNYHYRQYAGGRYACSDSSSMLGPRGVNPNRLRMSELDGGKLRMSLIADDEAILKCKFPDFSGKIFKLLQSAACNDGGLKVAGNHELQSMRDYESAMHNKNRAKDDLSKLSADILEYFGLITLNVPISEERYNFLLEYKHDKTLSSDSIPLLRETIGLKNFDEFSSSPKAEPRGNIGIYSVHNGLIKAGKVKELLEAACVRLQDLSLKEGVSGFSTWFCLSVLGVEDSPVSFNNSAHGFDVSGDNGYHIICFLEPNGEIYTLVLKSINYSDMLTT